MQLTRMRWYARRPGEAAKRARTALAGAGTLVLACAASVFGQGGPPPNPDGERGKTAVNPSQIVEYKKGKNFRGELKPLTLHVFYPEGHRPTDKRPVIVYFFGGGWVNGEPKAFYNQCAYFASRGLVAISADYRTNVRFGTTPFDCVADGKSAIRYVRAHAGELGIDPARIVAAGSSAGGHVAASTAIIPGLDEPGEDTAVSCRPDAMVLYNPVIDTSEGGYGNKRAGERWREISPVHHVKPGLPPTIVFHGDADTTVPYANAQAFESAMKAAGNSCKLVTFPKTGHGFAYNLERQQGNDATRETDRFLASLGYVKGEPTLAPPPPPRERTPAPKAPGA